MSTNTSCVMAEEGAAAASNLSEMLPLGKSECVVGRVNACRVD